MKASNFTGGGATYGTPRSKCRSSARALGELREEDLAAIDDLPKIERGVPLAPAGRVTMGTASCSRRAFLRPQRSSKTREGGSRCQPGIGARPRTAAEAFGPTRPALGGQYARSIPQALTASIRPR